MNHSTSDVFNGRLRLGVLGGGQLGKMLAQAASDWQLPLHALDADPSYPAASYVTNFVAGDFRKESDVLAFGRQMDILTVEIESVNTAALYTLQQEGTIVHPQPTALTTIKDKGLQKQFLVAHGIPTSPFSLFDSADAVMQAVEQGDLTLPFVQKLRTGGYDGRGVAVINQPSDLIDKLLPGACLVEDKVQIAKELSIIVARNERGEEAAFPLVEMEFKPEANLVECLLCPARVDADVVRVATQLGLETARAFGICGVLAVELFLTPTGEILVNEVAPRPHNSGHHTIEACMTSQYQQHLRGILNLPLGNTTLLRPAVMINLLGAPGHIGPARYLGLDIALHTEGVYVHLYGKRETRPYRKMGHITVLANTLDAAHQLAQRINQSVQVVSQ